jgi:hypothetical protein
MRIYTDIKKKTQHKEKECTMDLSYIHTANLKKAKHAVISFCTIIALCNI